MLVGVLGLGLLLGPEMAFAEGVADEALNSVAQVMSVVIQVLTILALLLIQFGGDLLGTEFITGAAPMEAILPLWRFCRNVVNVGFVLMLLYLAFANLFGTLAGENSWSIKEKLPKIIVAMIAVNFSLLAFRVILDAVHVGTVAILSISDEAIAESDINNSLYKVYKNDVSKKCDPESAESQEKQNCKSFAEWVNAMFCQGGDDPNAKDALVCMNKEIDMTGMNSTQKNLFLAFGSNFMNLEKLPLQPANEGGGFEGVVVAGLFSFIMGLAYLVALVAVFLALLSRVIVMWLVLIISPAIVGASIMGFGGAGGDIAGRIIQNIIMPLKIALALSLSFVMISAMDMGHGITVSNSVEIFKMGRGLNLFSGEGGSLYSLMWKIATVVIFWQTAQWAIKESVVGDWIKEKVMGGALEVGKFALNAGVLDRQFLPVPGAEGGTTSINALLDAPKTFANSMEQNARREREKDYVSMGLMSGGSAEASQKADRVADSIRTSTSGARGAVEALHNTMRSEKLGTEELKNSGVANRIISELKKKGVDTTKLETLFRTGTNAEIKRELERLGGAKLAGELATKSGTATPENAANEKGRISDEAGKVAAKFNREDLKELQTAIGSAAGAKNESNLMENLKNAGFSRDELIAIGKSQTATAELIKNSGVSGDAEKYMKAMLAKLGKEKPTNVNSSTTVNFTHNGANKSVTRKKIDAMFKENKRDAVSQLNKYEKNVVRKIAKDLYGLEIRQEQNKNQIIQAIMAKVS